MKLYVRSNSKKSQKNLKTVTSSSEEYSWKAIQKELRDEASRGINSQYEGTRAGSYIEEICQDIEDAMGLLVEPSIQAGQGSISLENTETGKWIREDYEEFCQDIVDMALDAESEQDFKSDLKNFYDRYLDWIAEL